MKDIIFRTKKKKKKEKTSYNSVIRKKITTLKHGQRCELKSYERIYMFTK